MFVSYAHADDHDAWVTELVKAIRAEHAEFTPAPLRVFFDRDEIRSMDDWQLRIFDGLHSSRLMLAVLSENYFDSDYCREEWEIYVQHETARGMRGEAIAPIYIVAVPNFEDADESTLDRWRADLKRRQFEDVRRWRPEGIEALRRIEVRNRLKKLDQQISERLQRAVRAAQSKTTVPRPSRRFVGRDRELTKLREALPQGKVTAITAVHGIGGIGGIGKTALAFMYSQTFADHYPGGRFLVDAEGLDDLRIALVRLAPALDIRFSEREQRDLELGAARVRMVLEQRAQSLLVLDNVDRPELLAERQRQRILPAGDRVHVVVTTRLDEAQLEIAGVECLSLAELPDEDAVELLHRHRPIEEDDAWKAALRIARLLGGHALALEVVAIFLWRHPEVSYADYLARIEEEGIFGAVTSTGEHRDVRGQLSQHPETLIGPLLAPTLETLTPAELRTLEYAALLPPDAVALPWLRELVTADFPEELAEKRGHADPWLDVQRRLSGLRLLTSTDEVYLAQMHRFLQEVVVANGAAESVARQRERLLNYALARTQEFSTCWSQIECAWEGIPLSGFAVCELRRDEPRAAHMEQWLAEPVQYTASLAEAESLLQQAVACGDRLAASDPGNAGWQRELSVSQKKSATCELPRAIRAARWRPTGRAWKLRSGWRRPTRIPGPATW